MKNAPKSSGKSMGSMPMKHMMATKEMKQMMKPMMKPMPSKKHK